MPGQDRFYASRRARGLTVSSFVAEGFTAEDPASVRERDLRMLTGLIDSGELTDEEREAFGDMHEKLEGRVWTTLTRDQRRWVEDRCDAYQVRKEPARPVLRGREVPLPEVLQPHNLPKKPPSRKAPG